MPRSSASVADDEIARFSRDAEDWWNPVGKFQPLHRLNPLRVGYVLDQVEWHFQRPIKGLSVLDVGCGGGVLDEPLARLGAKVTGFDASEAAIKVARKHSEAMGLAIDYRVGSVEQAARGKARYDIITALEIAEHVADLDSFVSALASLLKPNGLLIMSTLNRTAKSFALGIVAAEYLLSWVPRGTHQWRKFIKPSELVQKLEARKLRAVDLTGLAFDPLRNDFALRKGDVAVNYLLTAVPSA